MNRPAGTLGTGLMLSILIVNWNTKDQLRACLASIRRFPPGEPHEVIVVDNASADGSAGMVASEFPSVKLIEPGRNTGYAGGNNLAFTEASGEWLLTLNPDTEFEDGSIQMALNELRVKKNHAAVGIRLVGRDGKRQRSVRGFPTPANVFGAIFGRGRGYSLPDFNYKQPGEAPQPMGTFLMFRREALVAVGDPKAPFDERFPIFFNDVDLLKRLSDAGWPCWYSSAAHVLHWHGASTSQAGKSMIWESHNSLVRYFVKHLRWPGRILIPAIALASFVAAFAKAKGYHAGFRP
ncbi:MAG: glycosyltransferase family 2 protein [Armatimonadetes bacterium]|nr:glycosyltransferase family 2 protein [Armatimonadota bacterium]